MQTIITNYFSELMTALVTQLIKRKASVVTAESCTGGLLAKYLTDLPKSSLWFDRGFITYSIDSKIEILEVSQTLIESEGVVSQAVAQAMAEGALKKSHAQISIAITGIAGPEGGSLNIPLGTVWFAWHSLFFKSTYHVKHFEGDRNAIREQAVFFALQQLYTLLC